MPQTPSTRWCPTPEQLMILEEMYKSGVRTPNASQIQQITAHLSFYGKIEGKNVFYWFQNHKARDRQKLRRRLSRQHFLLHGCNSYINHALHAHPLQSFHSLEESHAPSPTYHTSPHAPLHFIHQGYSGHEEAKQDMNLICKLEASNAMPRTAASTNGYDWMMMMIESSTPGLIHPCDRPALKTLDLFPTKSTGLKDKCSAGSKQSSSFST